ncbi:hypothetical protein A2704_02335 [Candidatus Kaiserbacteria bacterium RIFCSPHIGHO2_01_FULL_54_36b]|uniref:Uncharacterized protein n=1 Tax=Candidatus Kaiserbacteria bacterium RIFCSPHIGHO2_01_FULL_54_36b TaxID=1798483 RepID=A0A1F6CNZ0_9BACT|nr:MAG: hypothetical protein A2704_02335 [Candidatus Kaiserbacteria bacterium RIFCSPHIGHO2_01_FULL_54_36b]
MFGLPGSIFALVIALGLFIALGMMHRRWLLGGVLAFYPAALIYGNLPFFAPTSNFAAMGTFVVLLGVCWWAISRHVSGEWGGGFARTVGLAIGALALLIALWVFTVPTLGTILALAPTITNAAQFVGYGGLLLVPVVLLVTRLA